MNINEDERELIERALDDLWQEVDPGDMKLNALYCRAISIVRELPKGVRRLRSDFNTRRPLKAPPLFAETGVPEIDDAMR